MMEELHFEPLSATDESFCQPLFIEVFVTPTYLHNEVLPE